MHVGQPCAGGGDTVDLLFDQLESGARDQHRRGVEDVLARGTEVHPARRVATDLFAKCAYERFHRVSGSAPAR
jgi:hypothetical protein